MSPKRLSEEPAHKESADLQESLAANPLVQVAWNNLTEIGRRDFLSWIESAKQAETRVRRIRIACENIAAGKRRPCCYAVVPMDFYKALGENPSAKAHWSTLSPNERRDLTDWIEAEKDKDARKVRVQEACEALAAGKIRP